MSYFDKTIHQIMEENEEFLVGHDGKSEDEFVIVCNRKTKKAYVQSPGQDSAVLPLEI